jgi:hypothetical protein
MGIACHVLCEWFLKAHIKFFLKIDIDKTFYILNFKE